MNAPLTSGKPFTIYHSLFTLLRFRWRSKVSLGDESRSRRIILLRFAADPDIFGRFLRRLNLIELRRVNFAVRCDRYLALQVRAINLRIDCFETIKHTLRRMSVTIPGAV